MDTVCRKGRVPLAAGPPVGEAGHGQTSCPWHPTSLPDPDYLFCSSNFIRCEAKLGRKRSKRNLGICVESKVCKRGSDAMGVSSFLADS